MRKQTSFNSLTTAKFIEPTKNLMDTQKTKVVFRIWPKSQGGEVIALFPQLAGTNDAGTCLSYMHVGQNSSADLMLCRVLKLATPTQYANLKRELKRIGYNLKISKRATRKDYDMRKGQTK